MSVRAATAYIALGADFAKFNREVKQETSKKISQKVNIDLQRAGFEAELKKVQGRLTDLGRQKVSPEVTIKSGKAAAQLAAIEGRLRKLDGSKAKVDVGIDEKKVHRSNQSLGAMTHALGGLYKQAAIITAGGIGAQAVSALGAAAVATTASLAPLGGALAAYPALLSAGAQATGVFKLATQGLADAMSAGQAAQKGDAASKKKYAEELAKLTPEQKKFTKLLIENVDKLDTLKRSASGLFGGGTVGFSAALKNFPVLNRGVRRTSLVLGDLLEQAGKLVGSKAFGRDLDTQMGRNDVTIRRLGTAGLHLGSALRHVVLAAGPLVDWMTRLMLRGARLVDVWARNGRESGKMARFFEETRRVMTVVGHIARDLAIGLVNIFKAAYPVGSSFLRLQERLAARFRQWTQSARGKNEIADFFRRAKPSMIEVEKLIGALAVELGKLGKGNQVAPLLRMIRLELLPAFSELVSHTTASFGPVFLEAVKQGLLLFSKLGGSSGPLVSMALLLGTSARILNQLIDTFPVLGTAIVTVMAIGGLSKAMGLPLALTQMRLLTGQARVLAAVQAGGGAAAAAGGAPAVGGAALGAGLLARARPLLLKGAKGLGVGMAISLAGSLMGSVVGGKAGKIIGSSTAWAGVGAGIGFLVAGPMGAAIGGGAGLLAGGLLKAFKRGGAGNEAGKALVRDVNAGIRRAGGIRLPRVRRDVLLKGAARDANDYVRAVSRTVQRSDPSQPWRMRAVRAPDTRAAERALAAYQRKVRGALSLSTRDVKFWSVRSYMNASGLQQIMDHTPPRMRAATARTMVDQARVLEKQGRLPQGAAARVAHNIAKHWRTGIAGMSVTTRSEQRDIARQFGRADVERAARKQATNLRRTWGAQVRATGSWAGEGMTRNFKREIDDLQFIVHHTTGAANRQARKDLAEVQATYRRYSRRSKQEVLDQLDDLAPKSKKKSQKVARLVVGAMNAMATGTGTQAANAASALQGALENMGLNGNAILKALGIKPAKYTFKKISPKAEKKIAGSMIDRLQRGGMLPGQRDGDRIPALLEEGEYVVNKRAVAQIGQERLDALNFAGAPRFAAGGAIAAANQLDRARFPYVLGAAHGTPAPFGPAFDCSSAVSYVLQHAGVNIPTMASGPMMSQGQPGSDGLTIYATPAHVLMRIAGGPNGGFFGTSKSNPGGGPGWIPPPSAGYLAGRTMRHFAGGGDFAQQVARQVISGPDGTLKSAAQGEADRARKGINKFIAAESAKMGDAGDGGPGGAVPEGSVRSWIAAGLRLAGQAASGGNIATLYRQVMSESGGDPRAQNNWDSNAKAGHPSKGLLQTIDSTFNAYKVPGHGNIWNPIDNVAAAVRYMIARYGHLVGTGSGYRAGGLVRRMAAGGYVVKAGDTLQSIAKHYHTTSAKLAKINRIKDPDRLHVGQKLFTTAGKARRNRTGGFRAPGEKKLRRRAHPMGADEKLRPPSVKALRGTLGNLREHISGKTGKLTDAGKHVWGDFKERIARTGLPDVSPYADTVDRDDAISQASMSLLDADKLQSFLLEIQNARGVALPGAEQDTLIEQWLGHNTGVQGKFALGWLYQKLHDLAMYRHKIIGTTRLGRRALRQFAKDLSFLRRRRNQLLALIRKAAAERKKLLAKKKSLEKQLTKAKTKVRKAALKGEIKKVDASIHGHDRQVRRWQGEYDLLGGDSGAVAQVAARRDLHTTAMQNLRSTLAEVQGPVSEHDKDAYVDARQMQNQPINRFLGQILDTRLAMREGRIASYRLEPTEAADPASVAESATEDAATAAATEDTSAKDALIEIQKQLLSEANLRASVAERQFTTLRDLPAFGGSFAEGGVVPGPAGAPRTIVAHGGETITPAVNGLKLIVYGDIISDRRDPVEAVLGDRRFPVAVERVTRPLGRRSNRRLPSSG